MADAVLKRSGPVTLLAQDGAKAGRGVAQTDLRAHCNGIWIEQFRWEPDYQPPKETDTLYDLYFDDDTSNRVAQGHVSPDASNLTDIKGKEPVEICFNMTHREADWFTELESGVSGGG